MEGGVIAQSLLDVNREVLHRAANAYHLVTDRLSGDDALSDSTLAVVMALVHFECLGGRYQQGLVHFKDFRNWSSCGAGFPGLKDLPGYCLQDLSVSYGTDLFYSLS